MVNLFDLIDEKVARPGEHVADWLFAGVVDDEAKVGCSSGTRSAVHKAAARAAVWSPDPETVDRA